MHAFFAQKPPFWPVFAIFPQAMFFDERVLSLRDDDRTWCWRADARNPWGHGRAHPLTTLARSFGSGFRRPAGHSRPGSPRRTAFGNGARASPEGANVLIIQIQLSAGWRRRSHGLKPARFFRKRNSTR